MQDINKYGMAVATAVALSLFLGASLGMRFSFATLLFGFVAILSAPVVIHRIEKPNWAVGLLVGLGLYASFPLKKLLQTDNVLIEIAITLGYIGLLWLIGAGWKRRWS